MVLKAKKDCRKPREASFTARGNYNQHLWKVPQLAALGCLVSSLLLTSGFAPTSLVQVEIRRSLRGAEKPNRTNLQGNAEGNAGDSNRASQQGSNKEKPIIANLLGASLKNPIIAALDFLLPPVLDLRNPRHGMIRHGKMLPTSEQISEMDSHTKHMRTEYFQSYYTLLLFGHLLSLELVRQCWNKCIKCKLRNSDAPESFKRIEVNERRKSHVHTLGDELDEDEVAIHQQGQSLSTGGLSGFVVYHLHFNFGCLFLAAYAWWHDCLNAVTGMDWELYAPWAYSVMLVQWICLFARMASFQSRIPPIVAKCFLSYVPGFSDKMNVLKDTIATAIYASTGDAFGLFLAFASILSIILPDVVVYREPELVSDLMLSYLDPYIIARDVDIDPHLPWLVKAKMRIVSMAVEQTSPLKRTIGLHETVPQALLALAYGVRYSFSRSLFIIAISFLQVLQLFLMMQLRPYILCLAAAEGVSWNSISCLPNDVRASFLLKSSFLSEATKPEVRFKAGQDILHAKTQDLGLRKAILVAIPEFMMHNELEREVKREAEKQLVLLKDVSLESALVEKALTSLGSDEDRLQKYKHDIEEYKQEQSKIVEQKRELENQNKALTEKVDELEGKAYDCERELEDVKKANQEQINRERHKANQENEEAKTKIAALEKQVKDVEEAQLGKDTKIAELEKQLEEEARKSKEKIDELMDDAVKNDREREAEKNARENEIDKLVVEGSWLKKKDEYRNDFVKLLGSKAGSLWMSHVLDNMDNLVAIAVAENSPIMTQNIQKECEAIFVKLRENPNSCISTTSPFLKGYSECMFSCLKLSPMCKAAWSRVWKRVEDAMEKRCGQHMRKVASASSDQEYNYFFK